MNPAPREYSENFYKVEIEGQRNRLARLKERQTARRNKYGGTKAAPPATAAAPAARRSEGRPEVEAAVLRVLEDPVLPLPCTIESLVDRIDQRQAGGASVAEVEEAVRALARGHPRLEHMELEGGGNNRSVPLRIAAVRWRGGKDKDKDGGPDDRKRRRQR
jgi:hypothetical protein